MFPTPIQPALDQGEGSGVEPDRALLASLAAQYVHGARLAIEILGMERQDLAESKAAAPPERQKRPVSDAGGGRLSKNFTRRSMSWNTDMI